METSSAVFVTGASSGIGEAAVIRFASLGFRVFAGILEPDRLDPVAAHDPARIRCLPLDVTDSGSIAAAVREVTEERGERGLQGLINSAGVSTGGPLEYVTPEALRRLLAVNVTGLHAVTRAFLPLVRKGRGRIAHMGSPLGRVAPALSGPYSASKVAVEALAAALRLELAPEGIPVSVVMPGAIRTPMLEQGLDDLKALAARLPPEGLRRYGPRLRLGYWNVVLSMKRASPVSEVSDALVHALTARRPRRRYVVGRDARTLLAWKRWVPGGALEALYLRSLRRKLARLANWTSQTA